ncbi:MAG: ABC transporter ATP-binding protein/permease [Coriobacteriia bacterium]|nr:ABC transporter ATP-binding protein/permease [Coriobacteriia bacterium]MCL2870525.1 ABC transporter ATP-binding protein/permease [Coriobacteriia bacterium]
MTKRSLYYYWKVTRMQLPMFILAVVSTVSYIFFLSFINPLMLGRIIDRVSADPVAADQVFTVFGPYILIFLVVNLIGQAGSKLQDWSVWKLQLRANYELATISFEQLSKQSMNFHNNRFGGSLVSATTKFINGYSTLIEVFVYAWLAIFATAIFTVAILTPIVPWYVASLSILLTIYVVVANMLFKRILPLNAVAANAQNKLSGVLSDIVTNILSVKTYGRETYEFGRFEEANKEVLAADSRRMWSSTTRQIFTSALTVVIMMVVVLFITGGNAWFGITAGSLVMIFSYTMSLTMQFNRIGSALAQVNRAFGDAHDMTAMLDEPRLVADKSGAPALEVGRGDIDFDDVTFAYSDADDQNKVFRDFDLRIPAGQRVGLVGRSGSGKTTLTTLLLRLSNLQEGRITIDGQDIADVTQVSLRQQVGYVPQEPLLFHRSIHDNIAYGRPDADIEEVREAARKANALEFIEELPNGLDTFVGERGVKLSGGQRQRVAIARAILADTPILVLDEATSALDSESEKLIQDALQNLMQGRTSIVVAHRLSTVASLDRIVVLADGAIVEDGTHAELVAKDGEYAQLWNRQTMSTLDAQTQRHDA